MIHNYVLEIKYCKIKLHYDRNLSVVIKLTPGHYLKHPTNLVKFFSLNWSYGEPNPEIPTTNRWAKEAVNELSRINFQ